MFLRLTKPPYPAAMFGGVSGSLYKVDVATGIVQANVRDDDGAELVGVKAAVVMADSDSVHIAPVKTPIRDYSRISEAVLQTLLVDEEALPGLRESVQAVALGRACNVDLLAELQRRRDSGDDSVDEALAELFPELGPSPPAPTVPAADPAADLNVAPPGLDDDLDNEFGDELDPARVLVVSEADVIAAAEMEAAHNKADLQAQCIARGIQFDRADRKAVLVAKLLGLPETWQAQE